MNNFFSGLKVVELASVLAGPAAGMFFAELGAEVVKIENKITDGDVTRNWRIPGESKQGPSAYFSAINYKKKYLSLDLNNDEDIKKCHAHIQSADIVISNYSHRIASKLQVSPDHLRAIKSDLIFLQLNGFVESSRPAYDVVLQAETGWISMTGSENHPAKLPVALIDILAGHHLKEAALIGIVHKHRTNKGSVHVVNLEEVALASLANQATNFLMNNSVAKPINTEHPNIAPYGDWFETKDKVKFVLAIGSENHFKKLCEILKIDDDDRFESNTKRVFHRKDLREIILSKTLQLNFEEIADLFNSLGIPFGKIKKLDEVLSSATAQALVKTESIEGRETARISSLGIESTFD